MEAEIVTGAAGSNGVRDESSSVERSLALAIATHVREFRRQQGLTVMELAERCELSKGMLSKIENAQAAPSLGTLARLSEALSVPVTAFFRGLDEEQDVLYIKAGTGLKIEHKGAARGRVYQLLGRMRSPHDRFEPMLVTLTERADNFPLYQHAGTELLYMLAGRMEYGYGTARYLLEPGDVMQFVGEVTHGPTSVLQLPAQFLSIKSVPVAL